DTEGSSVALLSVTYKGSTKSGYLKELQGIYKAPGWSTRYYVLFVEKPLVGFTFYVLVLYLRFISHVVSVSWHDLSSVQVGLITSGSLYGALIGSILAFNVTDFLD
ncbi:hypothetical protein Tco_1528973, partial [Tanacetum coccineum]